MEKNDLEIKILKQKLKMLASKIKEAEEEEDYDFLFDLLSQKQSLLRKATDNETAIRVLIKDVHPDFDGKVFEMEKHQGHRCTGKCTKLDSVESKIGEGIKNLREEKECEHDWFSDPVKSEADDIFINRKVCKKCWKINYEKPLKDPFWLKVGDVIEEMSNGTRSKIIEILEDRIECRDTSNKNLICLPKSLCNSYNLKKIKLVSPAIWKTKSERFKRWIISEELFQSKEDAKTFIETTEDFAACDGFYLIWPAKDQFGREIWYEVEG